MALINGVNMDHQSLYNYDSEGNSTLNETLMRQIWDATPGDATAKLDAVSKAGFSSDAATWAIKNNLISAQQAQSDPTVRILADRGYTMTPGGGFNDPVRGGFSWGGNELGLWPVLVGTGAFAGAGALGAGAAEGGAAAGVGASEAGAVGLGASEVGAGLGATEAGLGAAELGIGASEAGALELGASELGAAAGATGSTAAGGVSGGAGGAGAAAGGTALSRLLGGNSSDADMASILGTLGATGLGVYGAGQQADAYRDIANQGRADRAPFLTKSLQYLNDPGAYISGPGKASMDATLRALSAKAGNPIDQPTSLAIATQAGMRDWQNAVTGFGNLGLAGEDARANLMSKGADADANQLNALGYGLGELTKPRRRTLADLMESLA